MMDHTPMFQTVNNTSGERWPTFGIVQYVSNGRQTCNCLLVHTINFMVKKGDLIITSQDGYHRG